MLPIRGLPPREPVVNQLCPHLIHQRSSPSTAAPESDRLYPPVATTWFHRPSYLAWTSAAAPSPRPGFRPATPTVHPPPGSQKILSRLKGPVMSNRMSQSPLPPAPPLSRQLLLPALPVRLSPKDPPGPFLPLPYSLARRTSPPPDVTSVPSVTSPPQVCPPRGPS